MTTTLVLIASGILIGAGIAVIWRDMQRSRRKAFVLQRDVLLAEESAAADAEVEITISHRRPEPAYPGLSSLDYGGARHAQMSAESPFAELQEVVAARERTQKPESEPQPVRPLTLEDQWAALQPALEAGISQVNAVLAPARLRLGPAGEAAWSYKNKGFGVYRRLLLGEESLAWARMEPPRDGLLEVGIKAHKPDCAILNGTVSASAENLTAAAVSDLLSACLKPAAANAGKLGRNGMVPHGVEADNDTVGFGSMHGAVNGSGGTHGATTAGESRNGEIHPTIGDGSWRDVDAIVSAALRATNGALAPTGARLLPLAPAAWDAEIRRHRMTLTVEVDASDVARMLIERLPHEMEVAVGVRDVQMIDLGRRRRIPIEGMTTHALAELIASCAWPAIARFKGAAARRPA